MRGYRNDLFPNHIWQLNRSLYGSRQGARRWQQRFEKEASKFGLSPTASDPAVYVVKNTHGVLIIHLHVDDSLLVCSSKLLLDSFVTFLDSVFDVKWTKSPSLYLGIKVSFDAVNRTCSLSQSHYIESTLDRFGMTNCNPVKTPLPVKTFLRSGDVGQLEAAKDKPYQQLVGCLQWIASSTRPDIAHAVSQLSRFNAAWTDDHWQLAKHVLRYLKGTKDIKITYTDASRPTKHDPEIYSDADFSQCPETSRSVTGYLIKVNGGLVAWNSRRQPVVAQSTAEAEYMAAADACRHLAWLRSFLFDIFCPVVKPTSFHLDSTSAISISTEEALKKRSRHIDQKHHFIREQYQQGLLDIIHVPTQEMLADLLTKPLSRVLLEKARLDNGLS